MLGYLCVFTFSLAQVKYRLGHVSLGKCYQLLSLPGYVSLGLS
jgi:hypothetical protein